MADILFRHRTSSSTVITVLLVFTIIIFFRNYISDHDESNEQAVAEGPALHRKLLLQGGTATKTTPTLLAPAPLGDGDITKTKPNRIYGDTCSKSDIIINQGPTAPQYNGIPIYTVEIMNVCFTGCNISAIHLNCGWFGSANIINPLIFQRLRYDDCLVNDGKPLTNGHVISFQYANTFRYPLSVSSFIC